MVLHKLVRRNYGRKLPVSIQYQNLHSFKVGLSPSEKICVVCLIKSPLKMMKNAFYFILKALFDLKIFKFLSRLFGHVGKTTD